jgi:hypothetical protein
MFFFHPLSLSNFLIDTSLLSYLCDAVLIPNLIIIEETKDEFPTAGSKQHGDDGGTLG